MDVDLSVHGPTSGCAKKLVDGRCQVHYSVRLVDLAVRSFPLQWFFLKVKCKYIMSLYFITLNHIPVSVKNYAFNTVFNLIFSIKCVYKVLIYVNIQFINELDTPFWCLIVVILNEALHQWRSGNAQNWKRGGVRFKPRRACRPRHSGFSVIFSETRLNTG